MRLLLTSFLTLLFIASCSAPIHVQTKSPYQNRGFHSGELKSGGLALFPTTSKEYNRIILQNADQYLQKYIGRSYVNPKLTAQKLNNTNTLSIYREAIETYQKTGIIDRAKFKEIGTALDTRYLMKIDAGKITTTQETEDTSYIDDEVDINSNEIRKNTASAIIIDSSKGEIVWEAVSKSTADEGDEFFNCPEDNEIVGENISGLMRKLFGYTNDQPNIF